MQVEVELKLEKWQEIALIMLGLDTWEEIPRSVRLSLSDAAALMSRTGGQLRSRQTIAAIIVAATRLPF